MQADTKGVRVARTDDARAIQAICAPIVADTAISFEIEPRSKIASAAP
jgi:hypothetical protein